MGRPKKGYRVNGHKVPGTTTITGRYKEAGGLIWWAFRQGQADPDASSPYGKRDEAAKVGTIVHDMVEAHFRGEEPADVESAEGVDEDRLGQAYEAFGGFLDWWGEQSYEPVLVEVPMVCAEHEFGGTPDLWVRGSNGLYLFDWKSGSGIYTGHLLQAAAYRHLHEVNRGKEGLDGTRLPDEPVVENHIINFSKDSADWTHLRLKDLDEEREQFLALRACYERDKRIKKRTP